MHRKIIVFITLIALVGMSLVIRKKGYYTFPRPGESMDEYSYSWVGLSLIKNGWPVGISGLDGYKNQQSVYINIDNVYSSGVIKGDPLKISQPWLDHPPGLGLLTGGWAYISGVRDYIKTEAKIIRKPIILLGSLNVALVFVVGLIYFGYTPAIISSVIYTISPLAVFGSRMIQAENALITFFLLGLFWYKLYEQKKRFGKFIFLGIIAGVGIWFKLSAVAIVLFGTVIIFSDKKENKKRFFIEMLIGFLPFVCLYIWYAYLTDWETFVSVFKSNSARVYGIGSHAIQNLITNQKLTGSRSLSDPWIIVGWISFFVSQNKAIRLMILSYLTIYLFFGSESYGWYTFPFFPMVFLLIGEVVFKKIVDKEYWFILFLNLLVLGSLVDKLFENRLFLIYSNLWRYVIFGLMLMFLFLTKNKKILLITNLLVFSISVFLSWQYVWNMDIRKWLAIY